MKTVLVHRPGGPEALDYTDAPMPAPGEREVLIRAKAFGVGQPDKLIRSGVYKWMPPLPANPGNDVAGEIEAIGSQVAGISVGQRVLLSARDLAQRGGCYAEYVAAPADAVHVRGNLLRVGPRRIHPGLSQPGRGHCDLVEQQALARLSRHPPLPLSPTGPPRPGR